MALITWVILNVTSILVPFALSPGFYKWGYAMPAHEVYQVLIDIWSRGCNPRLFYALPILFSLEIIGLLLSALGVYRRCHYAVIADERQARQFQERVDVALAFDRKKEAERIAMLAKETTEEAQQADQADQADQAESADREELSEDIRREDSKIGEQNSKDNRMCNFGPSFNLAFDEGGSS